MNSHVTPRFRSLFAALPESTQRQARGAYVRFQANPWHTSLRFKRIRGTKDIYSVRIGTNYRAIGQRAGDGVTWFWIGAHADYERLIGRPSGSRTAP